MSKKYFINNLDTAFGQLLLDELVKEPTDDPLHMCTTKSASANKPNGIKKILKRQKPKLFCKKAIEECQIYVYNINHTDLEDIQFGVNMMSKPFEDNKVFILVSDIMVWSNTSRKIKKDQPNQPNAEEEEQAKKAQDPDQELQADPEQKQSSESAKEQPKDQPDQIPEQKPIQYTFIEDQDYLMRNPLTNYQYIKLIEDKVLAIKRQNVKVIIICPGIIYGCGQDTFYELFKAAWLESPSVLPYLNDGTNLLPTIHLQDLVRLVIKVAETPPEQNYLLAFDETDDKSQKSIIEVISKGVGSGLIQSVTHSDLIEVPQRYLINLDIKPSKYLVGTPEQPVQFQWVARKGLKENIKQVLNEFCKKQNLRPMKLIMMERDQKWRKQSKFDFILEKFSRYYRIPILNVKNILEEAREHSTPQIMEDLDEEWTNILQYLHSNKKSDLNQTMKVFYRAIKWRLSINDCANRGYILENYPNFKEELEYIFIQLSSKKLKRKIPKKKIQPLKVQTNKSIQSNQNQQNQNQKQPQKQLQQPPKQQEEQPKQQQQVADQQGQEGGPKVQNYYPQSIITIKQMGVNEVSEVSDFFTDRGVEQLIYDTTSMRQHQIFESLRNYIERNSRPNNYLIPESQLLKEHLQFTKKINQENLEKKKNQHEKQQLKIKQLLNKRHHLAQEIFQNVRNQGQQEIKKMPFRNYLMEFVVPTLNEGLLQVSNIIPNDPVDLLAQYLYKNSYDV